MELKDKKATDFHMLINRGIKYKERHYFLTQRGKRFSHAYGAYRQGSGKMANQYLIETFESNLSHLDKLMVV